MALTLAQMKVGMADKVAQQIVDIFVRQSEVLELLPFDNCVSQSGVGSTLTYGYVRKVLPSTAAFRAIGAEYTASEATVEKATCDLKIFGGSFEMDRVLKDAEGQWNNMEYQFAEKIAAAVSLFHYTMIKGDGTSNSFEGLSTLLTGKATEYTTAIDISTAANLTANAGAFYEALQILIADTNADAIFVSKKMKAKINSVARVLGYQTQTEDAFGRKVTSIDGVRIIDLGNHYTVSGSAVTANSIVPDDEIYAVRFDVNDGLCGVTLTGDNGIKVYTPDFTTPGAVHKGEVEMVANIALKNLSAAGVMRNVKIVPGK